ncbi:hypothetical protein LCGC14_1715750 [marine sediment metagenome]|uniref:DUF5681 domain-containing protein n=1 Tax=marine sediment metagenome TaxID=412755 RepID=A0A0F9HE92_9ZZZZ
MNVITDTAVDTPALDPEHRERRGSHPNSLAALEATQWKPGQSGNPDGKRKGLTTTLAKIVDTDKLAEALWSMANDQKTRPELRLEAIKYIYARIEGSPVQAMRFSAEGDMMPLIFLHPGREAPVIEGESRLIEDSADTKD